MPVPVPTNLFRIVHKDNLRTILARNGIHAPNNTPVDGLKYKTIHNQQVQQNRHQKLLSCGPQGTIHDYVPFYFGALSVMMLNLNTGRVAGYNEGQRPIIYLVSSVQLIKASKIPFVFSDGHGLASFTQWFDDDGDLGNVDWSLVGQRYWSDRPDDNDRQRRKQAEFLAWQYVPWELIKGIAVYDQEIKTEVSAILDSHAEQLRRKVIIKRDWYYH